MRVRTAVCRAALRWLMLSVLPIQLFVHAARADEITDRYEIKQNVLMWLLGRNYAQLETAAASYLNDRARTSSGLWKLTLFQDALSDAFEIGGNNAEFWRQMSDIAEGWIERYPESANAHLAYAEMLLARGWSYRGPGYAYTVDPANWQPFFDYVEKTRVYLTQHEDAVASDPRFDDLMIEIANLQSRPESEFAQLANAALERHPGYYPLYFSILRYYEPRWHGNAAAIERFARDAVDRTRRSEGEGMYARIYWSASQGHYGANLFGESAVDWAEMKRGIDDVLKSYPDAWNLNNFAKFACLARDKEKAKDLVSRMSGEPIREAWDSSVQFESCRSWALEK